ncbi:hypothetical protein BD779DRAFT_1610446 [Infundibulicybe gibba]|nr:hypothetical protein BD779DRAFT_1610446 [Infundibulicybe gibba]
MPPFPEAGTYLKSVRDSSRALCRASQIKIDPQSIERLLLSPALTSTFKRVSASHGLALPLNFPSPLAELNLLSILSLLNFASGYRIPLRAETGRGAWDAIRAFVFSLYLTSSTSDENLLSAKGMKAIAEGQVAELMGVNIHIEHAHPTLAGITVGELGGPIYELVQLITHVLNDTGSKLIDTGYPDLGSFVVEALKEGERLQSRDNETSAIEVVLERLVRAFPAFQDMSEIDGQPIYCFKKALFLVHAVNLPVFSDNVLPSLLVHLGVIDISDSPSCPSSPSIIPLAPPQLAFRPKKALLTSDQAYIMRIINTAHQLEPSKLVTTDGESVEWIRNMRLPDLDMWLWAVAKDRLDYRLLERFVLRIPYISERR